MGLGNKEAGHTVGSYAIFPHICIVVEFKDLLVAAHMLFWLFAPTLKRKQK
jgi:hypothetical protein